MLKYRLKRTPKRKIIIWSTLILLFFVSIGSIVRYYALSTMLNDSHESGISGDIVYVNDLKADWDYYIGLNYTEVTNKNTLPGENTNKYNSDTLVAVQLTYDGHDVNDSNLVGLVSHTERQHTFVYYKYYPIVNGKVKIELIDNPYTARPTGKGFNGWVCDRDSSEGISCDEMTFSYDDDYYLRYVEVNAPQADENGDKNLVINLKASWTNADIKTSTNTLSSFNNKGMQQISQTADEEETQEYLCPDANTTYYRIATIIIKQNNKIPNNVYYFSDATDRREIVNGNFDISKSYNLTRTTNGSTTCNTNVGCPYLEPINKNDLELDGTYFIVTPEGQKYIGRISTNHICSTNGTHDEIVGYETMFKSSDLMRGYFYKDNSYTNARANLYYNKSGVRCDASGAGCTTSNSYKLIQANETKVESYTLKTNEKYRDGENASNCTTTINEWKECTVLEPKKDDDDNYVYEVETDEEGNTLYEPKRDLDGNIIYETELDDEGNTLYEEDLDGNIVPVYKTDADGNKIVVYEEDADGERIPIYILDEDGEKIFVYQDKVVTINNPSNYYYLVTRDTNILNLSSNINLSTLAVSKPFTVTAAYNDVSVNTNSTITNDQSLTIANDMVIENIKINGPTANINTNSRGANYVINTLKSSQNNTVSYNFKIGRKITFSNDNVTAYGIIGGINNKVIVQSGKYRFLKVLPAADTTNNHSIGEYGNDYDRVIENNNNLTITFQALAYDSNTHSSNILLPISEMIIKSGTFGSNIINNGISTSTSYYTYGIYAGGISDGTLESYLNLKVEGGRVFSINGGPCVKTNYSGNATGIYITGGTIDNVVGGAGTSTTYGNRIISVTGGRVNNAVAGGSNSYTTSGSNQNPGPMNGDTLVYIGGGSHIGGTPTSVETSGTNSNKLYAVDAGSVFGAGLGVSGSSNAIRGVVNNSHVIINGGTIDGNVYGGGNYGSTGTQLNDNTKAVVELLSGTVKGSVFGGANNANGGYTGDGNNGPGTYTNTLAKDYYYRESNDAVTFNISVNYTSDITRTCSYSSLIGASRTVRISNNQCQVYYNGWSSATMKINPSTNFRETGRTNGSASYPNGYYLLDGTPTSSSMICTVDNADSSTTRTGTENVTWPSTSVEGTNSVTQSGTSNRTDTITYSCYYINPTKVVKAGSVAPTKSGRTYYEKMPDGSFKEVTNFEYEGITSISNNYKHNIEILLDGATVNESIYGGSNSSGTIYGNVNINLVRGSVNNTNQGVYGGGKGQNTQVRGHTIIETNTDNDNSLEIYDIYGGSENGNVNGISADSVGGESKISINGGTIINVYGGAKGTSSAPYTYGPISVTLNKGIVNNVFGGNNIRGIVTITNNPLVTINGGTVDRIYGGSNGATASAEATRVIVNDGKIKTAVYGGGKQAPTNGTANVTINGGNFVEIDESGYAKGNPAIIYGGGERASVTTTNVNILTGATIYDVFGGSDQAGVVNTSNVNADAGNIMCNAYGGGNIAEVNTSNLNLNGSTFTYELREGENIYNNSCGNAFGGGKNASVGTSNVKLNGSILKNVYGGSNQDGVVNNSKINVSKGIAKTIFGGNNAGGSTKNSFIEYNEKDGMLDVDNVFGGSNGKGAKSENSTYVQIINGTINEDVYGGGNEAQVVGSTIVNVYGGSLRSVYGGGNSSFVGDAQENGGSFVEGSGSQKGSTRVNVVGGNINRNVYGSGNSSFVYGDTTIKIGDEAISDIKTIRNLPVGTVYNPDNSTKEINIHGSVFGGSETNAEESKQYDYTYKGVIGSATVYVGGTNYGKKLNITGSIFGSGNNSMTDGNTKLYVNKYGLKNNPSTSTSIQQFQHAFITDSYLELLGDRDRANGTRYKYSLIRIDDLYVLGSKSTNNNALNGSELYLSSGSTFLKEIRSGYMDGIVSVDNYKEQTTIEQNGTLVNRGSDNKIYMGVNKVLAVSNSERPAYESNTTTSGHVHGMAFLGMYINDDGNFLKGIYDSTYKNGDIVNGDIINQIEKENYTFVYGRHDYDPEEQIKTNGYYSHYVDDSGVISIDYVGVTPTNTLYYKWVLGEESGEIVVDLQATRYSVEGAVDATINLDELIKQGASDDWHDAILTITNVDTSGFTAKTPHVKQNYDTYLVDRTEIPFNNLDDKVGGVGEPGDGIIDANQLFALSMGTTSTGWINNYKTNFYDKNYGIYDDFCDINDDGDCVGDSIYIYDSTIESRNLSFWLHYSRNLDFSVAERVSDEPLDIDLGSVIIKTTLTNIYGDPTSTDSNKPINIVVNISMYEGDTDAYGVSLAPGKKYEMFSDVQTDIASDGSFSLYQSMYLDLNGPILSSKDDETWSADKLYNKEGTIERNGTTINVSAAYRALNSSYVFPVGTKITMLDLINNEQYIYEVTRDIYNEKSSESANNNGKVEYKLRDFIKMGNTNPNNKFDDDMNGEESTKYRLKDKDANGNDVDFAREEFIFTVDFSGVKEENRTHEKLNPYLYMSISRIEEEKDTNIKEVMSPKGVPSDDMDYRIFPDVDSEFVSNGGFVTADGKLSNHTEIYKTDSAILQLNTALIQTSNGERLYNVSDTIYDDYKIGAKLTVWSIEETDDGVEESQLTTELRNTVVTINGKTYNPEIDGTISIQLAGRITDVSSLIDINFSSSPLSVGTYKLKVETYATYDGKYYGDLAPITNEFTFTVLSDVFGLDVSAPGEQLTHDVLTGKDVNNSREINYTVKTVSGVLNPNLKISLERRTYDGYYDKTYEVRDLSDLAESVYTNISSGVNVLNSCGEISEDGKCLYYNLGDVVNSTASGGVKTYTVNMTLKNGPTEEELANKNAANWKSGTYRVVFTMYDGDTPIGSVYEYLIIRSLDVNGDSEGS